jgi:ribosomal protein L17
MKTVGTSKIGDLQNDYVRSVAQQIVNLQQGYYEIQRVSVLEGDRLQQPIAEFVAMLRTFAMTLRSLGKQNKKGIEEMEEMLNEIIQHINKGEVETALEQAKEVMIKLSELLETTRITKVLFFVKSTSGQTEDYINEVFKA